MKYFIIILLNFLLLFNNHAYADTAADRCSTRDCLCRVTPGRYTAVNGVTTSDRRTTIFFNYDSSEVSRRQRQSIVSFFERLDSTRISISIIGYADGCGTSSYNQSLSRRRANSVLSIVRAEIPRASARVISSGERSGACPNYDDRRVDVVIHGDRSLTTRIERVPADVYLVDASASMWSGYRNWNDVINASIKPGSRIYLSIMSGCRNGQTMSSVSPQSGTEIWYSYWRVLDFMEPGETLLIISDFDSNFPISARESQMIERKVRSSGVRVHYIRP